MLIFGPFLWSILPNFENPGKKDLGPMSIDAFVDLINQE
jgi:hypothetical protein